ncbi:hypothetical protein V8E55_000072 [Tylopilus felleus]
MTMTMLRAGSKKKKKKRTYTRSGERPCRIIVSVTSLVIYTSASYFKNIDVTEEGAQAANAVLTRTRTFGSTYSTACVRYGCCIRYLITSWNVRQPHRRSRPISYRRQATICTCEREAQPSLATIRAQPCRRHVGQHVKAEECVYIGKSGDGPVRIQDIVQRFRDRNFVACVGVIVGLQHDSPSLSWYPRTVISWRFENYD